MLLRGDMARIKSASATALRLVVVFALTFSTVLGGQVAFAAGSGADGKAEAASSSSSSSVEDPDPEPDPDPDPDPSSSSSSSEEEGPYVDDLGIYVHPASVSDSIDVFAFASGGIPEGHEEVSKRGDEIDFDAMAYWNDGTEEDSWTHVTWEVDDDEGSVAVIEKDTGVLTAKGNGSVIVSAVLDKGYAEDDEQLVAQCIVDITGQDTTPYVTDIVICDEDGNPIDPSYTLSDSLSTAMVALQARVTVHDPGVADEHDPAGDEADAEYLVIEDNGLSEQTDGQIADLSWTSLYDERGAFVATAPGVYRPSIEGDNMVYAISDAGVGGTRVQGEAMVILEGEGHAQSSLTIDAVWDTDMDTVVASKTFNANDIGDEMKLYTKSYTVYGTFGKVGFVTYTGRGVLLADLLKAAGIDDKEGRIVSLRLDCYDTKGYEISWDLLVGKDRYYLPNADIGSSGDAEQVPPMLAIESARAPEGSSDPVASERLTDDDCFRLLFGVGLDDEGQNTRMMQRRWVNAIHVIMKGPPPSEGDHESSSSSSSRGDDDDGKKDEDGKKGKDDKKGDDNDDGSKKGDEESSDDPSNDDRQDESAAPTDGSDDQGQRSDENGEGRQSVSDGQADSGQAVDASPAGGQGQAPGAAGAAEGEGDSSGEAVRAGDDAQGSAARHNQGAWSILAGVNRNDSDVDAMDLDNPFAPYTAPTCAGVFVAGGAEAFLRFRWQKRAPKASEVDHE